MKQYIFPLFAAFYIVCIVLNSIRSCYNMSYDYYAIKKDSPLISAIDMFLRVDIVRVYAQVTGAGTGYGFFAPNVKSSGVVITESCGQKMMPHFNSFETKIRYHSLSSCLVDDIFNKRDSTQITKANVQLEMDYYNLAFKNIALKLMNDTGCTADSVSISYNVIALPTLAEKRTNKETPMTLLKYKELTFSLNNK
jgi:hypothetical protein